MCFYTKGSKIRIATKDIVCYKLVIRKDKDYCFSFVKKFKYEYNKKYSDKSKWTLFKKWLFNDCITQEAYHSRKSFFGSNVKCIIPKGSLYLINNVKEEYCSSSIIIKQPLL